MVLVISLFASNRKCRVGSRYGELRMGLSMTTGGMGAPRHEVARVQFTAAAGQPPQTTPPVSTARTTYQCVAWTTGRAGRPARWGRHPGRTSAGGGRTEGSG